jgi:hypothetical protein
MNSSPFSFVRNGLTLRGVIDRPVDGREPVAGVLLVNGHSRTNATTGMFADHRERFTAAGLACGVWDRAGCGDSDGAYDHYQPVEDSGEEAAVAFAAFSRETGLPPERIGWWGISRAGWICPYAMRHRPDAAFWISVSGGGERDNFPYLVRTNLGLEGHTPAETDALAAELDAALVVLRARGNYDEFLAAMPNLAQEPFIKALSFPMPREEYERVRDHPTRGEFGDTASEAARGREYFAVLAGLRCPTLALFGERDTFVDWRDTALMYREAFASGGHADRLTIRTFPAADHGIWQCEIGSVLELIGRWKPGASPPVLADGYFDAMLDWLVAHGFALARTVA